MATALVQKTLMLKKALILVYYGEFAAHHAQLMECIMTYKKDVYKVRTVLKKKKSEFDNPWMTLGKRR